MTNSSATKPLTVSFLQSPLQGKIKVPGDKSISHRALMFAALATGESHITGLLEGEDVMQTAQAMQALGAKPQRIAEGEWHVIGKGIGQLTEPEDVLNMGNSGTSARLLSGILASHGFLSIMTGDGSLRKRPMKRVTVPLSETGARFETREGGKLPMAIIGTAKAKPLEYCLPVASAQVKSAILLAGLNAHGITCVEEPVATRDHTENMLSHFGVEIHVENLPKGGKKISVKGPVTLTGKDIKVPGDPSSATFMLVAAAMIKGSDVCIENVGLNPLRTGAFEVLKWMGIDLQILNERIEGGEPVGDLVIKAGELKAVDVPPEHAPSMIDEYPILSVAAAFAHGKTIFRGLEELRVKESDRFTSIVEMLRGNGVQVDIDGDDLIIHGTAGNIPGGGLVATHMDHRLAMSASILGLVAQKPVKVDDITFIRTSFPNYFPLMNALGAKFDI